tara:strand:- start:234 stop:650 length:417 start_codon:yes stop_codon:yes gene_type:complete
MANLFQNDPKARKKRFLRGLNFILEIELNDKDIPIAEIPELNRSKLRNNLANYYCLEFTTEQLTELIDSRITTGEFTEKYYPIIYQDRGNFDLNSLIGISMKDGAIDCREMDSAPKYGLNGKEWCDVAEGPCACGATH